MPEYFNGNVSAICPDCGPSTSTFEYRHVAGEYGSVVLPGSVIDDDGTAWNRKVYRLVRCAGCGRGGLATIYDNGAVEAGRLAAFYPLARRAADLPASLPSDVTAEFREAELCASAGAWRGGSALLRSALEKTLQANGYTTGTLNDRIDAAAADGVITAARQRRAHDEVRSLGNDVLHDPWRAVSEAEYELAHHYVQRIIEDLYDHPDETQAVLRAAGRIT